MQVSQTKAATKLNPTDTLTQTEELIMSKVYLVQSNLSIILFKKELRTQIAISLQNCHIYTKALGQKQLTNIERHEHEDDLFSIFSYFFA
jgi:hypothetical protein